MTPFTRDHRSPASYTEGLYALSAVLYSREEAALEFSAYLGRPVDVREVYADRVRWQFAPEGEDGQSPGWWLGASGRGSMAVWWVEGQVSAPLDHLETGTNRRD